MDKSLEEYRKERDLIIEEIGDFDEEDFVKSGISLEEYTNPTAETVEKLVQYVSTEYDQVSIYSEWFLNVKIEKFYLFFHII